jgi:hypothetical protein
MNARLHVLRCVALWLAFAGCGGEGDPKYVDPWGDGGFVPGEPIAVDEEALESWVYVSIDTMRCGDGSAAGVFVNFTQRSRELLLFLGGGGVCYDDLTCSLMKSELEGLGEDPQAEFLAFDRNVGIFDREDETNPFRDASFVVVPHCTGDFHLADSTRSHPTIGEIHQVGHANVKAVVRRVVPTFADATRITFAGFSAGGVGVTGNYHLFASAVLTVGAPQPFLINDAGPLLRPPFLGEAGQEKIAEAWNLEATLFGSCPRCRTHGFHEAFARLHELYPSLRSSLICTYHDAVVVGLYTLITGASFLSSSENLRDGLLDFSTFTAGIPAGVDGGGQREFYYEGTRHGALEVAPLSETPGLTSFLAAQLEGGAGFTTTH